MSELPAENEIRQVYEPVFKFLDSIPRIINETNSTTDSGNLSIRADELDEQVAGLVVPFTRLAKLRALASQLAEPRRVEESDAWVADAISTLGQGIANWVRDTGYYLLSHELPKDGRRQLSPFDDRRPENPFSEEDFNRCRDLLINEEALLTATQKSAATQGLELRSESPIADKSEQKVHRKKSKGKRKILNRSLEEQILAALRFWHRYDDEDFNHEPADVRELARWIAEEKGDTSEGPRSSVSRFLEKKFKVEGSSLSGHERYCHLCNKRVMNLYLGDLSELSSLNQSGVNYEDVLSNLQNKEGQNEGLEIGVQSEPTLDEKLARKMDLA